MFCISSKNLPNVSWQSRGGPSTTMGFRGLWEMSCSNFTFLSRLKHSCLSNPQFNSNEVTFVNRVGWYLFTSETFGSGKGWHLWTKVTFGNWVGWTLWTIITLCAFAWWFFCVTEHVFSHISYSTDQNCDWKQGLKEHPRQLRPKVTWIKRIKFLKMGADALIQTMSGLPMSRPQRG